MSFHPRYLPKGSQEGVVLYSEKKTPGTKFAKELLDRLRFRTDGKMLRPPAKGVRNYDKDV